MGRFQTYKINRSNEILLSQVRTDLSSLQDKISSDLFSSFLSAVELVFSALASYFISDNSDWAKHFLTRNSYAIKHPLRTKCFILGGFFAICLISFKLAVYFLKKLNRVRKKSNRVNIHDLVTLFLNEVLTNITTAISLLKRAFEIYDSNPTDDLEIKTMNVYIMESFHYFQSSIDIMNENFMFENSWDQNSEGYGEFLNQLDAEFANEVFEICCIYLKRVSDVLPSASDSANTLIDCFQRKIQMLRV